MNGVSSYVSGADPGTGGRLVVLKEGQYPVVKSQDPAKQLLDLKDGTQALLLEKQGSNSPGVNCWNALVSGDILVVWEDQIESS